MTGIVDWAAGRARMILAFITLSLLAGTASYIGLPKEGEPDIDIPALFVSVPFPGISAEDSEKLLVKPMETELADLDGLKRMTGTASESYAGLAMEFEFGWDKTKILADVRDRMNTVEAKFPNGAEKYSITEINFSEFPIIVVNLSGALPERTLLRLAKDLQDKIESIDAVLEAQLTGHREEMLEVLIDPLRLEAYNVTAAELIGVVTQNNLLIAAGEVEGPSGAFSVKIPSSFDTTRDVYDLPVKTNGDRVITVGDLATIRLTFEDAYGTARFNGEPTVAVQVVKRKGFNLIGTAQLVKDAVAEAEAAWPEELRGAVDIGTSLDQSRIVASMVSQLEGSVLTAVALVMIVVLIALGTRSALLVGFAIPTSFLLCFVLLGVVGLTISNIVMFGLILSVGMLVDGAIVVVEYADKRIRQGSGPMAAYTEAAKRMYWPIVSSTATTLCAFMPMLFWPGVAGEFMGMLPVTLIFVLSASLVVALVYLPVIGGVAGRASRLIERASALLMPLPWSARAGIAAVSAYLMFLSVMQTLNPAYLFAEGALSPGFSGAVPGALMFVFSAILMSVSLGAARINRPNLRIASGLRLSLFGRFIHLIVGNPVMPIVAIVGVMMFVISVYGYYIQNNKGVEFFVEVEPEQAIVYVRARGNLSLEEKDALLRQAEEIVLADPVVASVFAFAGEGGLNQNTGGAFAPRDTVAQMQIEMIPWEDRPTMRNWLGITVSDPSFDGNLVLARLEESLAELPGVEVDVTEEVGGPASGKPVHLRILGDDRDEIERVAAEARAHFESVPALINIEDTLPLPGIDWQVDVDVEKAGRYGADVATVGWMIQLVTRGVLLDTMRVESSDEEIEIRVRFPEEYRVLSTLDTLKVRTPGGLVPLSNFITRKPVKKLGQIDRIDQSRSFDIKADVAEGAFNVLDGDETVAAAFLREGTEAAPEYDFEAAVLPEATLRAGIENGDYRLTPINPVERIEKLTEWFDTPGVIPPDVSYEWTGDQEDQAESQRFLATAFPAALGLMFVILLAQFNSFYNAVLVLLAVVLSTTGVLIGMLVMDQTFSVIMTGTGIVALAGIVVNNNIVLIDTYQEYASRMPRIEAITRTAQDRIRPVLLTSITTMAGLTPMMFGVSLDFLNGGSSLDSPTALWWKSLATAVVFGLGIATMLTLVFTPSMLALRVWISKGAYGAVNRLRALGLDSNWRRVRSDIQLGKKAHHIGESVIIWEDDIEQGAGTGSESGAEDHAPIPANRVDPGDEFDQRSNPPLPAAE